MHCCCMLPIPLLLLPSHSYQLCAPYSNLSLFCPSDTLLPALSLLHPNSREYVSLSPVLPSLLHSPPLSSLLPSPPLPSFLPSRPALFVTLAVSRAMCLKVDSKQVVQVHAEAKPGQDLFHVSGEETGDRDKAVWLSPSFHSSPPYLPFHHAFEIRTLT